MNGQLNHDPRSKQVIKDNLYAFLYEPVKRYYINWLDDLIRRNSQLNGNDQECFRYRGQVYKTREDLRPPRRINKLHSSLKDEMQNYIDHLDYLENQEFPYVLNFINRTLNATNSFQDYYAIFPESAHQPLKELADTCPCNTHHLSPEAIQNIQIQNQKSIELIKRRMMQNLLLN